MIRAVASPTATWAANRGDVTRFSRFEVRDHAPIDAFSVTTTCAPFTVSATAIAHWHDDTIDRLNCTMSGRSLRNSRRCSNIPGRSPFESIDRVSSTALPGRCDERNSATSSSTATTVTRTRSGSPASSCARVISAPPRSFASE